MCAKLNRITKREAREAAERYKLVGVHCVSCKATIEGTLQSVPGVRWVEVDPNTGLMTISLEEGADRQRILSEIRKLGYDAVTAGVTLKVRGLRTGGEPTVESKLRRIRGVIDVSVFAEEGLVSITYDPEELAEQEIVEALRALGLPAAIVKREERGEDGSYKLKAGISGVGAALFLAGFLASSTILQVAGGLLAFGVALFEFVLPALAAAHRGYATMDTLITLGTTTALIISLRALIVGGHLYFDAVVFITLFVVLGRAIEERLRKRANTALRRASSLLPEKARVKRGASETLVAADKVRAGEIVVVKIGERLPVDGRVAGGSGLVDEAPLTGEPLPRHVEPGSLVLAGSTLVQGYIEVTALRTGEYTLVKRAFEAAIQASLAKPKLRVLADRIAGVFSYIVMLVAGVTAAYWGLVAGAPWEVAALRAATVLVVACPCALGIAIPAALAAGVTRAYRLGAIIQNPDVLEALATVDLIALDKTGTLTKGRPKVVDVKVFADNISRDKLLQLAVSVEAASSHPLAKAVVEAAQERGLQPYKPRGFVEIPGKGVMASVNGNTVAVGNLKLMDALGVDGEPRSIVEGTILYIALDGKLVGALVVADEVREDSREALHDMERLGLDYLILTGDSREGALALARALSIPLERIRYSLDPIEKKQIVIVERGKGRKIAFVGDGINDAPALSAANIGIAVNTALDSTKQAGDVVLARDDLRIVPTLIKLSRKLRGKILWNLLWATIYNATLIPIAAGALSCFGFEITPAAAAAAMSMSSITVTLNSALLLRWKPK